METLSKTAKLNSVSRRRFLSGSASIVGARVFASSFRQSADASHQLGTALGHWEMGGDKLPRYHYTGKLPAHSVDREGRDAQENPDPVFLIGNYRITVLTHASGIFQIITGERAWARVNAADRMNYGANTASLIIDGDEPHDLVGLQSLAADPAITQREFGCGFARYLYQMASGIEVERSLSVAPSGSPKSGNPSLLVTITIRNGSAATHRFKYREVIRNQYVPMGEQKTAPLQRRGFYRSLVTTHDGGQLAFCENTYVSRSFTISQKPSEASLRDIRPANVFIGLLDNPRSVASSASDSTDKSLCATFEGEVPANGVSVMSFVIGLTFGDAERAKAQAKELFAAAGEQVAAHGGAFAAGWRAKLPSFAQETSAVRRIEMIWNAHAIEALATRSEYFNETFVPQGTIYTFEDGENISNRDHLQALLPLCTTNPPLAKSCLRYVFKQTTPAGEIKRGTMGFGYATLGVFKESDEQLYIFMALAEYLRATGDYRFLDEVISYYQQGSDADDPVLKLLQKHFLYLIDEIGLGPHGLIHILNSDWSDSFFHQYSPNVTGAAESHLNSAMALAVLPRLIEQLAAAQRSDTGPFITALETYRAALEEAYMRDLSTRTFSARAYLNDGRPSYGLDVVCLEPQGFLLQMPNIDGARKRAIYARVKAATLEKVGFRIREKPIFSDKGGGEDGGIWFALEHEMVAGLITVDRSEASRMLDVMSFHNYAEQYPSHSFGRWTNTDCFESSLNPREGLQSYWHDTYRESGIGYCSHAHSWPLFSYLRLTQT